MLTLLCRKLDILTGLRYSHILDRRAGPSAASVSLLFASLRAEQLRYKRVPVVSEAYFSSVLDFLDVLDAETLEDRDVVECRLSLLCSVYWVYCELAELIEQVTCENTFSAALTNCEEKHARCLSQGELLKHAAMCHRAPTSATSPRRCWRCGRVHFPHANELVPTTNRLYC